MVPTSVATRVATDVAATRRGCVQAITFPFADHPASWRYWGSSEITSKYKLDIQGTNGRAKFTDELSFHIPSVRRLWQHQNFQCNIIVSLLYVRTNQVKDGIECDESGNYERCLKMGRRSRADCTDRTCVIGAEEMIFPSVSVALSRVLPGPAVPGFQNCRDMTFVHPLTVDFFT